MTISAVINAKIAQKVIKINPKPIGPAHNIR
jgi:hypothetical protein